MRKFLRGLLFTILVVWAVWGSYRILSWKDTTGGYLSSTQQLSHTGEGLIDVLFLGSSHCYCSVYPDYLWRDSGIAAFDLAISGQDKWSSYYSLREALKTQTPKVVLVESYSLIFEGYGHEGNKYRNLLSHGLSADSIALAEKIDGENLWNYILRWPIVHTRYRELTQYDFVQYKPSVYGRGSEHDWTIGYGPDLERQISCTDTAELSEDNKEWLDSMLALSRENDFDLIFFVAPMQLYGDNQQIINAASEYVREQGSVFVDFAKLSHELYFDPAKDFTDSNHCNAYGAAKVTGYWRDYLQEHYQLADHRGSKDYELWDLSYLYHCRLEAEMEYNTSTDSLEAYLYKAMHDEYLTMIISIGSGISGEEYSARLSQCMEQLGIYILDYPQGGKWVWQNGECIFSMDGADTQVYFLDLSRTDTLRIENRSAKYGEAGTEDVKINRTPYGGGTDGIAVLLYDNFRGTVIGSWQQ